MSVVVAKVFAYRQNHKYYDYQGIFSSWIQDSVAISCSIQYLKGRCLVLLWFDRKGPNSFTLAGNKLEICQRLAKELVISVVTSNGKQQK